METAVTNKEFVEIVLNNAKIAYEIVEEPVFKYVVKCFESVCDIYPDITGYELTRGVGFLVVWDGGKQVDFMSAKSLQEFILYEGAEMTGGLHHVKDPALGLSTQVVNALIWNKNIFTIEDTILLYEGAEMTDGYHYVKKPGLGLSTQVVNALIWNKSIFTIEDTIPLFESGEIYKVRSVDKKGREELYNTLIGLGYKFTVKAINEQAEKDAMIFKSVNELAEKIGKPVEEVQAILKECDITVVKRKKKEGE